MNQSTIQPRQTPPLQHALEPECETWTLNANRTGSPDHILIFDRTGTYTRLSGEPIVPEAATGSRPTTEIWRKWVTSHESVDQFDAQRDLVFHSGQPVTSEATIPTQHGMRDFEYILTPVSGPDGTVQTVLATIRDCTEQKRIENALRFLAEASTVLDSSLDYTATLSTLVRLAVPYLGDTCAFYVVKADGSIQQIAAAHADPHMERIVNELRDRYPYDRDDTCGVPYVLRTGKSEFYGNITDATFNTTRYDSTYRQLLRQLGLRSAMIVPLLARGKILGVLSLIIGASQRYYTSHDLTVAEDLAHRAAISIDNARLYEEAQKAIRLRDDFLSIASHELRSPLTVLQLQLDSLLRAAQASGGLALAPEQLKGKLESSKQQVQRVSHLIDDLLDVSRLAAGQFDFEPEQVDLAVVVREAVTAVEEQVGLAKSSVHVHAPAPVIGYWHRARLEQVVTNLLSNAIKYSNAKPIELRVTADTVTAALSVHDSGIGIAPQDLKRIFNRFERAASGQEYQGSGLGLYIVRKILDAHGGSIAVTSAPGEGSTFTVNLPRRPKYQ